MGKTFRRDSNWSKDKEKKFRKQREQEAEIRRALRKAAEEEDSVSDSENGGTNDQKW